MLNIEVKDHPERGGGECMVCIEGDTKTICLQTVAALHGVYLAILKQSNPLEVERFKMALFAATMPDSSLWDAKASKNVTEIVMKRKEGRKG